MEGGGGPAAGEFGEERVTALGVDPFGTGPFRVFVPAVIDRSGRLSENPHAGAGGTALTATFG